VATFTQLASGNWRVQIRRKTPMWPAFFDGRVLGKSGCELKHLRPLGAKRMKSAYLDRRSIENMAANLFCS
jgi:hypothetical protein